MKMFIRPINLLSSLFILLFFLLSSNCIAQVDIQLGQQVALGGNGEEEGQYVIYTNDGGYLLSGYSRSGATGNKTTPNYGNPDTWLLKLDANFGTQWEVNLGGSGDESISAIAVDSFGNIFVAIASPSDISGNKTVASLGSYDYWLVKLSSSGAILWQKAFGGSGADLASSITIVNNEIFILGSSSSDTSAYKSEMSKGGLDYWLLKLDLSGNIIWDKTIGSSGNDQARSLQVFPNGELLVLGVSNGTISGDKSEERFDASGDIWVVKLSSTGQVLWDKTLGGTSFETTVSACVDDDNVLLAIASQSPISGNKTVETIGLVDCWLVKLDENGGIAAQKAIGGNQNDTPTSVIKDSFGHYLVIMSSNSGISGDKTEENKGQNDFWLVSLSNDLSLIGQKTIGSSGLDYTGKIIEKESGQFIILGTFSISNQDFTAPNYGATDYILLELKTDLSTGNMEEYGFVLSPNPTVDIVRLMLPSIQTFQKPVVSLVNSSGQVLETINMVTAETQLDFSKYKSGVYWLRLSDGNRFVSSEKIILNR